MGDWWVRDAAEWRSRGRVAPVDADPPESGSGVYSDTYSDTYE